MHSTSFESSKLIPAKGEEKKMVKIEENYVFDSMPAIILLLQVDSSL
jgi:hypothetical protein